jgi:3-hydroxyisobutyrate dehydrogenase-like beta-hydroxyacid dehydrogenase
VNIGFIGLGDMGSAIVPRLIAAGHSVTGWNRSRAKAEPLFRLGMKWAENPREAARQSDLVFSMVTNADAVRSVALGENGIISGLRKDAVYLDMSTIAPEGSKQIAQEFARAA